MICVSCKAKIPNYSTFCNQCGTKQEKGKANNKPKSRGNGQGSVYQLPNGSYKAVVIKYYYTDDNGKLRKKTASKTYKKKKDAILGLNELINTPSRDKITLTEVYNKFIDTRKYAALSKSQKDKLGYAWTRLTPLHRKEIMDISVEEMQKVIDDTVKTFYPARDMKVMLSHLFELAKKYEYITYNKTENLELPALKKTKKDAFNDLEIQKLWYDYIGEKDGEGNSFTGYILIMIYTGMRYGELSTALLENIFLKERYLIAGIKSEAGKNRRIPLSNKILPVIEDIMSCRKKKLLEMNEDNFYANYWEVINRLQINKLTPHCCRHTYFTRLASKHSISPSIIAEIGGHADFDVAFKNYIHTPLDELLKAVDQI